MFSTLEKEHDISIFLEQKEGIHQLYLFNNQLIDTPKSDTIMCIYPKPLQKANLLLTDVFQTIIDNLEDIIKIENLANLISTTKIMQCLGIDLKKKTSWGRAVPSSYPAVILRCSILLV